MAIKYLDQNGLLYFWTKLKTLIGGKVDKVDGKGLSTNDYTTDEKTKLAGIETGANAYTHPATHSADIIVDGTTNKAYTGAEQTKLAGIATGATANAPSSTSPKMDGTAAVGSEATFARGDHVHPTDDTRAPLASPAFTGTPTAPTPAAGDNSTKIATTAYVTGAVSSALGEVTGLSYQIVASLPGTGVAGVIYLVSHGGTAPEVYDEFIWVNSAFEKIGTTAVDLSGYVQTTDLTAIANAEIDVVVAS